jgi:histidine triad (HIT) family protein
MVELTQEQAQAMQEKLKNMSPEELKEFQKKQCIFCQIISGKVASKKIYSDDKCTAILDINPANPGHILLLPNEHYSIMPLVPADELSHLFNMAKALAHASLKALEAQGTNIFIANGVAAGQKAQHFMIHIIPRKEGDNVNINIPEKTVSKDDIKKVIDRLRPAIVKALGEEKEEKEPVEPAEEPEEEPETEEKEETEEEPEPEEENYITSEKARRFHKNECPFAQKIPEDSRIYGNQEEMEKIGKLPCSCTKLKSEEEEKKPKKKKEKKKTAKKKTKKKKAKKKKEKKETEEEPEPEAEEGITLDDIGNLLTGGAG